MSANQLVPLEIAERETPAFHDAPLDERLPEPIRLKSAMAFCAAYVPIAYAIEPFIRSSSLYTLTAKTGAGKTALLIAAALAVATGRSELIGRTVKKGRVAFISAENPDDFRMRLLVAARTVNIDLEELGDDLMIFDRRASPGELIGALEAEASHGPFTLIMIDTLAAFYTGSNISDPVEAGNFMRALRPLAQIKGRPSIVVAAHPRKNAQDDELTPYGAGAILNEVDGNLTLRKFAGDVTELHWQGKLRGVEFDPVQFRFELLTSPDVKDEKGRDVQLPVLMPMTAQDIEQREKVAINQNLVLIKAVRDNSGGSLRALASATGIHRSSVERKLKRLATTQGGKLVKNTSGKWMLSQAGQQAIEAGK
jgi:hypothetical protein